MVENPEISTLCFPNLAAQVCTYFLFSTVSNFTAKVGNTDKMQKMQFFFAFQSYLHKESQTSASQLFRKETYFETKDSDDDSDYETTKYKSKRYQKSHSMKKSSSTASSNKSQEIIDENNMT